MKCFKLSLAISSIALLAIGCAGTPKKTSESRTVDEINAGSAVTNEAARKEGAYNFVEVSFKPGTATLTSAAKQSLDAVLAQASSAGEIDEVMVLSWPDTEYPSQARKTLPRSQVDLAGSRNDSVRDYIEDVKKVDDVDAYNMAKRPGLFSRWFNTTDNRLKSTLAAAGLPTTADDPQYPSKASRSVILVKVK